MNMDNYTEEQPRPVTPLAFKRISQVDYISQQRNDTQSLDKVSYKQSNGSDRSGHRPSVSLRPSLRYLKTIYENKPLWQVYRKIYKESRTVANANFIIHKDKDFEFAKISQRKRTLVFDMDETLLRATLSPELLPDGYDFTINFCRTGLDIVGYVKLRPYLKEMLLALKPHFELILFTAGHKKYTQAILKEFQKDFTYFDHVLTRNYCSVNPLNENQIKDLKLLTAKRSLKEILLIDNKPENFLLQYENGVPISDFMGDSTDTQLLELTKYLLLFRTESDVRHRIL